MPSPSQDSAGVLIELMQSFSIMVDRFVGVFAETHGLHRTDLNAIAHIWRASRLGEPLTPKALAGLLALSPPATTALVDRLERAGYLIRTPDTVDRRRIMLHGQPAAQEVAQAFFVPLGQTLRGVMADYSEHDLSVVRGFMQEILAATTAVTEAATAQRMPAKAPTPDKPDHDGPAPEVG